MSAGAPTARATIPGELRVLIAAAFVIAIGFGLVAPVLPAYARSFDVGVTAASVVVSAFAFFRLVFAPAGGALVARLGERPVYLAGLLIVAASALATAFAQSYAQLLVFRGLGGIGSTMFTVSAMALLVRLAPPTIRGRVSSAYASSFLIGGMVGPLVGGVLAVLGQRLPFVVYAAALVVAAVVVATRLSGASLRPVVTGREKPPMAVREALGHPTYRGPWPRVSPTGGATSGCGSRCCRSWRSRSTTRPGWPGWRWPSPRWAPRSRSRSRGGWQTRRADDPWCWWASWSPPSGWG